MTVNNFSRNAKLCTILLKEKFMYSMRNENTKLINAKLLCRQYFWLPSEVRLITSAMQGPDIFWPVWP